MKKKFIDQKVLKIVMLILTWVSLIWIHDVFATQDLKPSHHFPRGTHQVWITHGDGIAFEKLKNIAPLVERSIDHGEYPGAVILAGHRKQIIYRGVFGNRCILPNVAPMKADTIFDLASLTKVVATTPSIMQLIEQGKLELDAPVATYWPKFADYGKASITIRQLLVHTSGLPPDPILPKEQSEKIGWYGSEKILKQIQDTKTIHKPGTTFVYSDINFIVLAHLIKLISGENLDHYAQLHIFKRLNMNHTYFLPSSRLCNQIAPTYSVSNHMRLGQVNDDVSFAMGGVAGHAGLFSNAQDLSLYARWLLNPKSQPNLLGPLAVLKMTTIQTDHNNPNPRGLGWDIDSKYSNRGILFSNRSFGHTGWTGTSLWIDPQTQTWLIILTSRTHPTPSSKNQVVTDRRLIANIVASSINDIDQTQIDNTGQGELDRAYNL